MAQQWSEYTMDSSKHFRVPWLILRALRFSPENKTSKASRLGNCFTWLLVVSSILLIIITTTALIKEPSGSLAEFMLRAVAPMRCIMCVFKIFVLGKKRAQIHDHISKALNQISYPKVLGNEVKNYAKELQTSSKCITAFVIFSFLYNVPTVAWGICLVLQQNEQEGTLIKLWLPFKSFYSKTIVDIMQVASILTIYLMGSVIFGFITLIITLAGMAVKMLRHLNRVMTTLQQQNFPLDWNERNFRDVVKYAIQQHQRCIAFIAAVNAMFSFTLLLDFSTFQFGLCSVTYHIVKQPMLHLGLMVTFVQSIIIYGIYLGVMCWYSDTVSSEGELVSTNCQSCAWWKLPDLAQDISIMACMAKVKLSLKAGPVYSLNMKTFLAIFEISLTYFLFLYQLN